MKNIYIFGAGGVGRDIVDIVKESGEFSIKGFIDDGKAGNICMDIKIYSTDEVRSNEKEVNVVIALGEPNLREKIINRLTEEFNKVNYMTIISKKSFISKTALIKEGSIIYPNVIINSNVIIEKNVFIGGNSSIGHDCIINENSVIAFNCSVGGNSIIERNVYIGSGSNIRDEIRIGEKSIVGMGSILLKNLDKNKIYYNKVTSYINENKKERIFK